MLYLTLLTPVLAIPLLLLMERLEAWTMTGVRPRPSIPWTRRRASAHARPSERRQARSTASSTPTFQHE